MWTGRPQRSFPGMGPGKALSRPSGSGLVATAGIMLASRPAGWIEFDGARSDRAPDLCEDQFRARRGRHRRYSVLIHYERKTVGVFGLSVLPGSDPAAIRGSERRDRNHFGRPGVR